MCIEGGTSTVPQVAARGPHRKILPVPFLITLLGDIELQGWLSLCVLIIRQ